EPRARTRRPGNGSGAWSILLVDEDDDAERKRRRRRGDFPLRTRRHFGGARAASASWTLSSNDFAFGSAETFWSSSFARSKCPSWNSVQPSRKTSRAFSA